MLGCPTYRLHGIKRGLADDDAKIVKSRSSTQCTTEGRGLPFVLASRLMTCLLLDLVIMIYIHTVVDLAVAAILNMKG